HSGINNALRRPRVDFLKITDDVGDHFARGQIDEFVDARSAECTASLPHMAVGGHYPSRFRIVENAAGGNCSTALLAIPVRVDEVGINDRGNDVRWMGRLRVEWI